MNRPLLAALAAAGLAAATAHASPSEFAYSDDLSSVAPPAPGGGPEGWHEWAEDFSREMHASMGAMFSGRVGSSRIVKGSPYSAEVVTETRQTLGDGNVISRKSTGAVYRDGEGRTRQETATKDGKPRNVYISDPVAGKRYILIAGARHPISMPDLMGLPRASGKARQVVRVDGTDIRIQDGKVTVDGKVVPGSEYEFKSAKGKTVRVENGRVTIDGREVGHAGSSSVVVTNPGDRGLHREQVTVQVVRAGDDAPIPPMPPVPPTPPLPPGELTAPMAPLPPMPGMNELRFESSTRLGKGVTTSLGMKDMEGLKVEGTKTVWTIPAGQIGNRDPINVTCESWYSPELLVTVSSRYSDPRTGESIYRLAAVKRGEPDAALFRKPPDSPTDVVRERSDRERPDRNR